MTPDPREITQTILAGDPSGVPGNCVQAAVASVLGLELDAVPHFTAIGDWRRYLRTWCAQQGWAVTQHGPGALATTALGIAHGPSPRGLSHAVVVHDGVITWDPHPSRAGLLGIDGLFAFTPADPHDSRHLLLLDLAAANYAEWGVEQ